MLHNRQALHMFHKCRVANKHETDYAEATWPGKMHQLLLRMLGTRISEQIKSAGGYYKK